MAQTDIPDAEKRIGNRDKTVPWYNPDLGSKLTPSARQLFETYSKIPSDSVEDHVYKIRDEAWDVWPYPCIGGFRFLDLAVRDSPQYPEILERLKSGNETFLDLGCCFGQEVRRLVADGAPSEKIYASDLRPEFFELGYTLFKDRETLKSKFIAADVFDSESGLKELDGKIDIVYVGSFLHLFGYAQQVEVAVRIVKLLKYKVGSLVVGRQVGHVNAGEKVHTTNHQAGKMFRHNVASFEKLWGEVGEKTGTKWKVEAEIQEIESEDSYPRGHGTENDDLLRRITFSVFRL